MVRTTACKTVYWKILTLLLLYYITCTGQAQDLIPYEAMDLTPPLVLEDLGGHEYDLEQYRNRVVLINFWASWCAPCVVEMPSMQRLKQAMKDRPFAILAVNVRESPAAVWKFRNTVKVDFPLLLDRNGRVTEAWQVDRYPSSFLIDPAGRIRHVAYGPRQWDDPDIVATIDKLLAADE